MVNFLQKRLQVFVSSTYADLKIERQAAVMAILNSGHIPAGMELFTTGDESQMDVIKQWIDESDVFLLILGGRYGSLEPNTGKSYIHLEYEYAKEKNKPRFSCIIRDPKSDVRVREFGPSVLETENPKEYERFRNEIINNKLVEFWEDKKDIQATIYKKMAEFARDEALNGWVRGGIEVSPQVVNELARLSEENAELRKRVDSPSELFGGLTFEEMEGHLKEDGLDSFLLKYRSNLSQGFIAGQFSDLSDEDFDRLLDFGIIQNASRGEYILSAMGRNFLNRLWHLRKQAGRL